ncbi:1-acyl-sn-glycerol-3-phosphate acyltransferase [Corynebacterium capitovis DSM 44611]|uniref:lysophospholipid acyltransferase family protein n=1 Tax=Corynebacterium capitovis TaxID=131081 RepID=UPI00037A935F|nr:lysophospholipid acyltransferase family protein [Corynebacterium capitovis]WKD58295.1 1-acyl-sn-glycerol-3-phosphate acyltransferase [Corynebacterium capitovis DSM 44611]
MTGARDRSPEKTLENLFVVEPGYRAEADHAQEIDDRFYQRMVAFIKRVFRAQGTKAIVLGLENLPREGGAVIAINHTGWFDFIFAGMGPHLTGKRLVRFMAKKEVFHVPVIGWLMRSMRHVPVDRAAGADSIDSAVEWIDNGSLVGIFPEGTISRAFELSDFKTGAARIAQRSNGLLIPCAIWGSQRIWTKDLPRRLGRTHTPVIVSYGPPVDQSGTPEEVTARLKEAMGSLLSAAQTEYAERFGPFPAGERWMPASLGGSAPTTEEAQKMYEQEKAARAAKRVGKAGKA